jgi:hypothetical protein
MTEQCGARSGHCRTGDEPSFSTVTKKTQGK